MKRLLSIILISALLLFPILSASAAQVDLAENGKTIFSEGDWSYTAIDGGSRWEINGYSGTDAEIAIPRIVNDLMVVSICDHCFLENKNITFVETSSPLWRVGEYAFMNCTSLETFECNFAMNEIGVGAFIGTTSLKTINLENSVVTVIRPHVFMNSGIEEITLPDTCTEIMHDAFAQCSQLKRIVIPASVTEIHEDAFKNSDNVVIYCYTDSKAHSFAEENSIPFVLLDATKEVTFILGDADGDGVITILDATKLQRILADLDTDEDGMIALRGDIDGDGLNVMDATKIQRHIADYSIAEPVGEEVTREVIPG
ncbi:MAG: leucine-rich repeat protein [Ruminococcus sp.]|nr:leucine-rich repeat protein [Ruminococcus sp.]